VIEVALVICCGGAQPREWYRAVSGRGSHVSVLAGVGYPSMPVLPVLVRLCTFPQACAANVSNKRNVCHPYDGGWSSPAERAPRSAGGGSPCRVP